MHLPLKDSEKLVRLYITQHLASLISWHLCTACVLRCTAHSVLRVCLCGITVHCVALCVCVRACVLRVCVCVCACVHCVALCVRCVRIACASANDLFEV